MSNPFITLARPLLMLLILQATLRTADSFRSTRIFSRAHRHHNSVVASGGTALRMQSGSDYLISSSDLFDDSNLPPVPLVLLGGVAVLVAAQVWINKLTAGDDGLGAFLNDGRGFSNSAFVLDDDNRAVSSDPLPWLKLPKLDFVEVAGQAPDDDPRQQFLDRLRGLQEDMEASLERGDYQGADRARNELEKLLSDNNTRLDS
jgi:hypothetical protein